MQNNKDAGNAIQTDSHRFKQQQMFNIKNKSHAPQTSEEVFYPAGTQTSCFQNTPQEPVNLTQFCLPGSGTPEKDKPELFGPIKQCEH